MQDDRNPTFNDITGMVEITDSRKNAMRGKKLPAALQ